MSDKNKNKNEKFIEKSDVKRGTIHEISVKNIPAPTPVKREDNNGNNKKDNKNR